MKKARKKQPAKKTTKKQDVHKPGVRHVLHNIYFSKPYKQAKDDKSLVNMWADKPKKKPAGKKGWFSKPKAENKETTSKQTKNPGFFSFGSKKEKTKAMPTIPEPKEKKGWFSAKPMPPPKPVEKPSFVPVTDKNLEKRLDQMEQYLEKRIAVSEQSITLIKDLFEELKKDNESLQRERTLILEKLSSSNMGMSEPRQEEEIDLASPEEKRPMSTFTENKNSMNTSLDQLLDMITEKGSVKISEAAKKLKIKDKQVEEWAKILEEHGLIEIQYPALGKPYLKKKT